MFKAIASVGGFTAISRVTGFVRDIAIAATLGNGLLADAFVVAQRLPNHFRAIFGEGAFNNAFVPTYAGTLEKNQAARAQIFAGRIFTLMALATGLFSVIAIIFMPVMVDLLAPGFRDDPAKFELTVALSRIAFPYLFCIVLVTWLSGVLNAHKRFAAAAFAPVLLNLSIIGALAVAWLFPNAAYAASFGVLFAGLLELALVAFDAKRNGILPKPQRFVRDHETRLFLKTLGPAIIGSAGVQIAMFADTIIASLLPTGSVASLYYADRLYQLPVGMIGLAAGTVLLPTMSKHVAAGRFIEAHHQQNRAILLTLALSVPFFIGFMIIPVEIMKALFARGAFTDAAAREAGAVLAAYGTGLLAIVLIRPAVASFYARNDTRTPLIASFSGIGVNLLLKIFLFRSHGAAGLAFATAVGAWVNLSLLVLMAHRRLWMDFDSNLLRGVMVMAVAALPLSLLFWLGLPSLQMVTASWPSLWQAPATLALLGGAGALAYFGTLALGLKIARVQIR